MGAAPRRLTPEAAGRTVTMAVGAVSELVVPGAADEPVVRGESVVLVHVVNVTDSGVREWEVRAVRAGRSTLTSRSPAYTITIVVR